MTTNIPAPVVEEPYEPTEEERHAFHANIKRILRKMGKSQRWLEEEADLATGTLSKVKSGRLRLTAKLLRPVLAQLGDAAPEAMQGTQLAKLVRIGETPQVREISRIRADLDRLRVELATAHEQVRQLVELEEQLHKARHVNEALTKERDQLQQAVIEFDKLLSEAQRAERHAEREAARLSEEMSQLQAIHEGWVRYGEERNARVSQLESAVQRAQQQARENGQNAIFAGLAGLGVGLAFGGS